MSARLLSKRSSSSSIASISVRGLTTCSFSVVIQVIDLAGWVEIWSSDIEAQTNNTIDIYYGHTNLISTGYCLSDLLALRKSVGKTKRTAATAVLIVKLLGTPGMIRTCDPLIRSQVLYPAELRVRK